MQLSLETDNVSLMTDRRDAETVGANVAAAISSSGTSVATVAEATDFTVADLNQRLEGRSPFTVRDLVSIGGFLHFKPSRFLEGVRA